MRVRTLMALTGLAAACSAPQTASKPAERDLHLGTSPSRDSGVVSDLEVGRTPKARTTGASSQATARVRSAVAALTAEAAPAPRLAAATTSVALAEPSHQFKDAPEPIEVLVAGGAPAPSPDFGGIGLQRGGIGGAGWGGGSRGHGIIIRGGMGGDDDDCDIRHPHGGPRAIHSLTPGFRGGIH